MKYWGLQRDFRAVNQSTKRMFLLFLHVIKNVIQFLPFFFLLFRKVWSDHASLLHPHLTSEEVSCRNLCLCWLQVWHSVTCLLPHYAAFLYSIVNVPVLIWFPFYLWVRRQTGDPCRVYPSSRPTTPNISSNIKNCSSWNIPVVLYFIAFISASGCPHWSDIR